MNTIRKTLFIGTMVFISSMAFGYNALMLKDELVCINNFAQQLRQETTNQGQTVIAYCEKILKNDSKISDEEILTIDRILTSDETFEAKEAQIAQLIIDKQTKALKKKLNKTQSKLKKTKKSHNKEIRTVRFNNFATGFIVSPIALTLLAALYNACTATA